MAIVSPSTSTASGEAELGIVARLASQKKKFKDASKRITSERDEARQQLQQAQARIKELEDAAPAGRIKELEAELRTVRHRTTFDRLAIGEGADPESLDDLFQLSGYQAKDDKPDEKGIRKLLGEQKAHPSRKRFFQAAESDVAGDDQGDEGAADRGGEPPPTPGPRPVPGGGRGGRAGKGAGGPVLTKDQLADPKFMLDSRNKAMIYEAAKNRGFRLPDREVQRGPQG